MSLRGTPVCSSSHHFTYRVYIETILINYGTDVKHGQRSAALWYKDQSDGFDGIASDTNTGYAS